MLLRLISIISLATLAGCPADDSQSEPPPDAAVVHPDAAPPPPPPPPLKGYGEACTGGNQCQSGLCVGQTGSAYTCSRLCTLTVANDCKAEKAFCVPIGNSENACYGSIDTGLDQDDAVVAIGDSVTRAVTPLGDVDLFEVKLDQLGMTRFTVTPQPSIDVKLEAYGVLGDPIGFANDVGPGMAEVLQTDVQQIGTHMFMAVRNVGASTGNYTLSVTHLP